MKCLLAKISLKDWVKDSLPGALSQEDEHERCSSRADKNLKFSLCHSKEPLNGGKNDVMDFMWTCICHKHGRALGDREGNSNGEEEEKGKTSMSCRLWTHRGDFLFQDCRHLLMAMSIPISQFFIRFLEKMTYLLCWLISERW